MNNVGNRFAVILCADIVGYSRLMGIDEERTHAALTTIWREVVDPRIEKAQGRLVRRMGDGLLAEFGSVIDAVGCALAIQETMQRPPVETPAELQIQFRMGITVGDVVSDGTSIYGDAVTIALRLESLAEPGSVNISRAVRDQIRDRLSVILTNLGEHQVESIARPVQVYSIATKQQSSVPTGVARKRFAAPPDPPALAVLPFQNFSNNSESEFFLDSVAEDLITELAHARWFSVIARNTAFSYKTRVADAKAVGRELGVRYVLEGSLRKAGERVRISSQLVEAASGRHLWSERFDGTMEDSFDLQDRIVESVIGSVGPVLRASEIERSSKKPKPQQDVYDLSLRALIPAFAESAEENDRGLSLLAEALEIEPNYPLANALSAWCHQQRHLLEWPGARNNDREVAKRLARRAIGNDVESPLALAVGAAVRAALTRDHDLALAAVDRATMMTNNSALVLGFDALTRCLCGAYDKAIEHAEKAMRLSPLEPLIYYPAFARGLAYFFTGREEQAAASARKAIDTNRNFAFAHCLLALSSARLGRKQEAIQAIRGLLQAAPRFRIGTLRRVRFADAALLQADLDLLRATRIPE